MNCYGNSTKVIDYVEVLIKFLFVFEIETTKFCDYVESNLEKHKMCSWKSLGCNRKLLQISEISSFVMIVFICNKVETK